MEKKKNIINIINEVIEKHYYVENCILGHVEDYNDCDISIPTFLLQKNIKFDCYGFIRLKKSQCSIEIYSTHTDIDFYTGVKHNMGVYASIIFFLNFLKNCHYSILRTKLFSSKKKLTIQEYKYRFEMKFCNKEIPTCCVCYDEMNMIRLKHHCKHPLCFFCQDKIHATLDDDDNIKCPVCRKKYVYDDDDDE